MNDLPFDPVKYYSSYPNEVISRPGYPSRAAFKSSASFKMFGRHIFKELGHIDNYADIGGCFGFGANSMSYKIEKHQGKSPNTFVFEISPGFVNIGKLLFPKINFIESFFDNYSGNVNTFDLITAFDVVEHVLDPKKFLIGIAGKSKFVMLITPMETNGYFRGNKPPEKQGEQHIDGHVNFFTPSSYVKLLEESGLRIIDGCLMYSVVPPGAFEALMPEHKTQTWLDTLSSPKKMLERAIHKFPGIPWEWKRSLVGGGIHISICRSKVC